MKYVTSLGTEVELRPIRLNDARAFAAYRALADAASALDECDKQSAAWWDARAALHERMLGLCDALSIPRDSVSEHDLMPIITYIETGDVGNPLSAAQQTNARKPSPANAGT